MLNELAAVASTHEGLKLLLLYGSRARGESTQQSDWDFGYLATERFDPDGLRVDLVRALGVEAIDLANLERTSGQLRFRAARDGKVVFAADSRVFPEFWHEAVSFWCDVEPILKRGFRGVLERLPHR